MTTILTILTVAMHAACLVVLYRHVNQTNNN